jgi:hypothetical protein
MGQPNCMGPMNFLCDLLERKCDQYAQDDDADLASELTPAMQRLRKMEVHPAGPRYGNVTEGLSSAMR